jgi:hypothetical protein
MRLFTLLTLVSLSAGALAYTAPNCHVTLRGSGLPTSLVPEVADILRSKGFTITNTPGALQFKYETLTTASSTGRNSGIVPGWTFPGMLSSLSCRSTLPIMGLKMVQPFTLPNHNYPQEVNAVATDANPRTAFDCGQATQSERLHREVLQTAQELLDCRDIDTSNH